MTTIPSVTLNNNITMPQLGLGVWQAKDGEEVRNAVLAAIEQGYRLIDTAAMYGNEGGIGEALLTTDVPREELFITTKLWNSDQGYDRTLKAFNDSLTRLKLEYIDLYLIHWPAPALGRYTETWKAFEEIYASGRARAIGVCNFNQDHLDQLLNNSTIVPAVNQIELHPRLQQSELRKFCLEKGIQVESWSPLGGTSGTLLDDPTLRTLAATYNKSPAQIVLRWHLQEGLVVIPKSVHPDRIRQNADIFDFELSASDMEEVRGLNTNTRRGPDPGAMNRDIPTKLVQFASKLGLAKLPKEKQ